MSTSEYPATGPMGGSGSSRLREYMREREITTDVLIVIGLTVLAAVIRFATISSQSFWTDEALTAYETHLPLGAMINTVAHVETTPPLYFVLVWGWAKVFGTSEAALRSLSALAGIALIPVIYMAARELASRRAAVIAAALAIVNPFMIWYSQEARSYMLLVLLTAASFLWFVRALRDPSRRNVLWWAALSALAVATHFFAGFMVAPEALWLLWVARTRIVWLAVGAVGLTQVAMLPFALIDTTHGAGWIHAIALRTRIGQVPIQFAGNTLVRKWSIDQGFLGAGILALLAALLLTFGGDSTTRRGAKVAGVIGAAVILLPLGLALVGQDYFLARNVIPAWVPLAIVVAIACAVPRARIPGIALATVLVGASAGVSLHVMNTPILQRAPWRDVARSLGPAPVTRVVLAAGGGSADPLKIYLPHVAWVQPRTRVAVIDEVDIVGTQAHRALEPLTRSQARAIEVRTGLADVESTREGGAMPRYVGPRDAVEISRVRVHGWVVARFRLLHPQRTDLKRAVAQASRYFLRTPEALLSFIQYRGR